VFEVDGVRVSGGQNWLDVQNRGLPERRVMICPLECPPLLVLLVDEDHARSQMRFSGSRQIKSIAWPKRVGGFIGQEARHVMLDPFSEVF
jgi:hypothetical protein